MRRIYLVLLALLLCKNLVAESSLGVFYFGGLEDFMKLGQLNGVALEGQYVRTGIDWDEFQDSSGNFHWDGDGAKKIEEISKFFRVLPSIRARSSWAVVQTNGRKCASAPKDLDRKSPLRVGQSYSSSYSRFIKAVIQHYPGMFDIVVIENEMNDEDFWCSGYDAYLRLFLTAKKAIAELDPRIRVSDGGIQGSLLNRLVLSEYFRSGNIAKAQDFYRRFTGQSISRQALEAEVVQWESKAVFKETKSYIASPLFDWEDLVNFHYYQVSDGLPDVVSFLRRRIGPTKALMTNEIGIKKEFAESPNAAARHMVMKFAQLSALKVSPIVWFTPDGEDDQNMGAVTFKGDLVQQTSRSYLAVTRFLGPARGAPQDLSTEQLRRLQFPYLGRPGSVSVVWPAVQGGKISKAHTCTYTNYLNHDLPKDANPNNWVPPLFEVCP